MSDEEEGSQFPKIERNSSIWKRVSWNNTATAGKSYLTSRTNDDGDERMRLLDGADGYSDEIVVDVNKRDEEMGLGGGGDGGGDESSKTLMEKHLDETQSAVHKTIGVLLKRGEDINELRSRADELEGTGSMFKKTAKKAYNEAWLDHFQKKSTIIAVYIVFTLVVILLVLGIVHMIINSVQNIQNPAPRPPPTSGPPPAAPMPTGSPGTGGGGGFQVTCNCYCPPYSPPKLADLAISNKTKPSFMPSGNSTHAH